MSPNRTKCIEISIKTEYMANIIYPEPDKKEKWIKALNEGLKKGFMSKQEFTQCIELGGIPEDLALKVKARIDVFGILFHGN